MKVIRQPGKIMMRVLDLDVDGAVTHENSNFDRDTNRSR